MEHKNWYQDTDVWGKTPLNSYSRETEGRKTKWDANVSLSDNKWIAEISKRYGKFWMMDKPRLAFRFGYFETAEKAMDHVDEYLKLRRNPNTWNSAESNKFKHRLNELEVLIMGIIYLTNPN